MNTDCGKQLWQRVEGVGEQVHAKRCVPVPGTGLHSADARDRVHRFAEQATLRIKVGRWLPPVAHARSTCSMYPAKASRNAGRVAWVKASIESTPAARHSIASAFSSRNSILVERSTACFWVSGFVTLGLVAFFRLAGAAGVFHCHASTCDPGTGQTEDAPVAQSRFQSLKSVRFSTARSNSARLTAP